MRLCAASGRNGSRQLESDARKKAGPACREGYWAGHAHLRPPIFDGARSKSARGTGGVTLADIDLVGCEVEPWIAFGMDIVSLLNNAQRNWPSDCTETGRTPSSRSNRSGLSGRFQPFFDHNAFGTRPQKFAKSPRNMGNRRNEPECCDRRTQSFATGPVKAGMSKKAPTEPDRLQLRTIVVRSGAFGGEWSEFACLRLES